MTKKSNKKRVELDVRPHVQFKNYDYGGPEDGDETSPGRGLYNGKMDKYDSVEDFIKHDRERKQDKRKEALLDLISPIDQLLLQAKFLYFLSKK